MWKRFSVQKVGIVISLLFLFSSELFAQTRERPIEVGVFLTTIDLRESVGEKPGGFVEDSHITSQTILLSTPKRHTFPKIRVATSDKQWRWLD